MPMPRLDPQLLLSRTDPEHYQPEPETVALFEEIRGSLEPKAAGTG
jgi:hypothetical protein